MGRLQHKVAIIIGAGSGIGLESAILFASEGANVVLADINLPAAERAAKHIAELYPNTITLVQKTDVGKESDIKALVDAAIAKFGRLDVMFNNAGNDIQPSIHITHAFIDLTGIMHPDDSTALETEESIWDLTMQANVKGV